MKKKNRSHTFTIIFFVILAIFLFIIIRLGIVFYGYHKADSAYKQLEEFTDFSDSTEPSAEDYISPIDFKSLAEVNPDIVAWVYFETMDISYPIVQGEDNDYYLHHSFEKEESSSGCIFMDTDAAPDFSGDNTFIYGHNMKNKSMFAKLNQFVEDSFYQENPTFLIYTPTETRRYQIYSCYPAELSWDSFTYEFGSKEAYAKWQQTVRDRSLYDTGVTPDTSQKTVTLMTCTPKGSSYRFLVHGALIETLGGDDKSNK